LNSKLILLKFFKCTEKAPFSDKISAYKLLANIPLDVLYHLLNSKVIHFPGKRSRMPLHLGITRSALNLCLVTRWLPLASFEITWAAAARFRARQQFYRFSVSAPRLPEQRAVIAPHHRPRKARLRSP